MEEQQYVDWNLVTREFLDKYMKWSDVFSKPSRVLKTNLIFDWDKFEQDYPNIRVARPMGCKYLIVNHPWLYTPYGYSPLIINHFVSNRLSLHIENPEFKKRVDEWDEWFIDQIWLNIDKWGIKKCFRLEEGVLTRDIVRLKYYALITESQRSHFPPSLNILFGFQREEPEYAIKEDKTIAICDVWEEEKFVSDKLINNDENKFKGPRYCQSVFCFEGLSINQQMFRPMIRMQQVEFRTVKRMKEVLKEETRKYPFKKQKF